MKKLIFLGIGIILLSSAFSQALEPTRLPNGLSVATKAQEANADVATGKGTVYIYSTVEIDGAARLDGATTVNAALTSSDLITGSSVTSTNLLTCGTITSGIAATEIYQMDQAVRTTDDVTFDTATITKHLVASGTLDLPAQSVAGADLVDDSVTDTQLAYDTGQNLTSTSDVTFDTATITKNLVASGTLDFPSESVSGADLVNNSVTSTQLADDVSFGTVAVTGGGITMENSLVMENDVAGQWNIDDADGNSLLQVTDAGTAGNADVSGTLGVTGNTTMTKLTCNGDFNLNSFVTVAATATVTVSSSTFVLITDTDDCSLYLPDAGTSDGKIFIVKKTGATGTITLDATAGGNIDGSNTNTDAGTQYDCIGIISDGTNWHIFLEVE